MLSQLDHIIYPDRCEVYEIVPSQRYFYPIFKNGSSSIMMTAQEKGWRVLVNEQIRRASNIDIVLRDPVERMRSGINTYVQQVKADNPELDKNTILWFAENYLFLNRHYAPQFSWLANLARYLGPTSLLKFYSTDDLDSLAVFNMKPPGIQDAYVDVKEIAHGEMYLRLDQALIKTCMGKSLSFGQVLDYIQLEDCVAYDYVVGRSKKILEPIYALSKT